MVCTAVLSTNCYNPVKTTPVIYIIAPDWTMRTAVRAELREISINSLGMDSGDEAGHVIASGGLPGVIVLEVTAALLSDLIIQNLIQRVPTILVSSRTVTVSLPDPAAVPYCPVRISEIVARVRELLARSHAA